MACLLKSYNRPMHMQRNLRRLYLVLCLSATLVMSACGSHSSQPDFSRVVRGMTIDQVTGVLGQPDSIAVHSCRGIPGSEFIWREQDAAVKVDFIKGRVAAMRRVQR